MQQHPEKIDWWNFNQNTNPTAFEYLIVNLGSPNLLQHPEHINLIYIANNPQLFKLDYAAMSLNRTRRLEAELGAAHTPKRTSINLNNGGNILDYE